MGTGTYNRNRLSALDAVQLFDASRCCLACKNMHLRIRQFSTGITPNFGDSYNFSIEPFLSTNAVMQYAWFS